MTVKQAEFTWKQADQTASIGPRGFMPVNIALLMKVCILLIQSFQNDLPDSELSEWGVSAEGEI